MAALWFTTMVTAAVDLPCRGDVLLTSLNSVRRGKSRWGVDHIRRPVETLIAHALFVCLHNAGRSQMSQALFERNAAGRHTAASAGTNPANGVHPQVIEVMREVGIDLAGRIPQRLTTDLAERADVVVTMGCGDQCPYIPGKRYVDWELPDPQDLPIEAVRGIRDEISHLVRRLVQELDKLTD